MLVRLATLSAAIAFVSSVALAQNAPPARNGNVYNGMNPQATVNQEKAAGVALPPDRSKEVTKRTEQLDKNIQDNGANTVGPAKSLACSTVPATCQ